MDKTKKKKSEKLIFKREQMSVFTGEESLIYSISLFLTVGL